MADKFEKKLFQMAGREKIIPPETLEDKIDIILTGLPESWATIIMGRKKIFSFKMNFRKALVLSAALVMLLSITATAAAGFLRQRMEALNREKMEEYFAQIYTAKIGMDNYNRPYTPKEQERMEELLPAYQEQGVFPKGELTMLDRAGQYKGKGVAFLKSTSTFFLPEDEMDDEQLLQLLDFYHKRDYSLAKINEKIASGETGILEKAGESGESVSATDLSVLQSQAVLNPEQELTIPYEGGLSILYMAAGRDCLFLTGWNEIHKMEIGGSDSVLFFDEFDTRTRISALYQTPQGEIYLGLYQKMPSGKWNPALWVLDGQGILLRKIDISSYIKEAELLNEGHTGSISSIAVDKEGYIYLRGLGIKGAELVFILDGDGKEAARVPEGEYSAQNYYGLGIGKDGKAYTVLSDKGKCLGIASVNPVTGQMENIHMDILPEQTIAPDIIAPAYDADFVLWSYSGIFSYNLGEEEATVVMPAYETPCNVEGSLRCALADGRIVLAYSSEYRHDTDEDGEEQHDRIPEKTCFYYKSSVR